MNNMSKFDSYRKVLTWFAALTLSALAAGCGGGGGGGDPILGTGGGAAITAPAPKVTIVAPLVQATGVGTNLKAFTVAFTNAMDPATLTPATFTLACPAGTPITGGVVTYFAASKAATLTLPAATNLPANTVCTATITTGVKDAAGVPLASNFAWTFTTAAGADTTAPTVTGTINGLGALNVAVNTKVGATFSEAMDPSTITNANFTFSQTLTGTAVAGTVSYVGVNAVFTPSSNLAPATNYTALIKGGAGGVKDLAGNVLAGGNTPAGDYAWSWVTAAGADTTAPTVTGTVNANGATNVTINTKIGATFSEGMDPLTITNANFALQETVTSKVVAGVVSYSGVSAVFVPLSNLTPNTNYTVTIKGGVGGVTDLAGNPMASTFQNGWTTAATPDTTAPTVTGTFPVSRVTNVAINTRASVTFSEAMDPLTITNLNVRLQETATGNAVPGILSYAGVTATFIPSSNLKPNTNYTVTAFGGVSDLAGNPMNSTFQIGWTTGATPDTTAPTVTGALPASLQTNAGINTRANVTFSEAMDPLTITNLNVRLQETATGAAVAGTLSYAGVTATIIPSGNLNPNTNYTTTVFGGVKDLAGNIMNSTFQVGWTTGATPDTTAPTVVGSIQNNGQINVPINTKVGVTFSEAMDPLTITNLNIRLRETATGVVVPSTLSYSSVNALIIPLNNLKSNTNYTTTVFGDVKDLAGNLMNSTWEIGWTTAAVADVTEPVVTGVSPVDLETGVALNKAPYVLFSEWMDPLTITNVSFTLTGPGGTSVAGTVLTGGTIDNALFTPLSNLATATTYTATIKGGVNGVKDVAGNALAADKVWSFTTAAAIVIIPPIPPRVGPAPIVLNSILTKNFVITSTTGITNTGTHGTLITGNITSSGITGAAMNGVFCTEIAGTIYEDNAGYVGSGDQSCAAATPPAANGVIAANAIGDAGIAYGDAASRPKGVGANLNVGGGTVSGQNFAPGIWTWTTAATITGDITLTGTANDTWLFQLFGAASDLVLNNGVKVHLAGGAVASNVFWYVEGGTGVTLNTTAELSGTVMTAKQIIFRTGAKLHGRALAGTQTVLDANTVGP